MSKKFERKLNRMTGSPSNRIPLKSPNNNYGNTLTMAGTTYWSLLDRVMNLESPTDFVTVSLEQMQILLDIWDGEQYLNKKEVPNDLIVSNTIPLNDIEVQTYGEVEGETESYKFRICIIDEKDRFEIKEPMSGEMQKVVGCCMVYLDNSGNANIATYIILKENILTLFYETVNAGIFGMDNTATSILLSGCLCQWYSVMLALLHPTIKEIFQNPKFLKEKIPKAQRTGINKNKVHRYVKYHVINTEELKEKIYEKKNGKYTRRTLVWHVIGHYRTYKSGKKIWIAPYWKGTLRETKRGETIKRELVGLENSKKYGETDNM